MTAPRTSVSLNGWWDFLPDTSEQGERYREPGDIPSEGWLPQRLLVPGSWTRGSCVPELSETGELPWEQWRLHDSFGNPPEWDAMNTAWYRRTFAVDEVKPGRRYFLHFGGVLRYAWYFVNGRRVGRSIDGMMPSEHDITAALQPGENELHVFVTDYERTADGKVLTPCGSDQMARQKGIWQDVALECRPDCRASDVTIRTSTRTNTLTLLVDLVNDSDRPRTVTPRFCVTDGGGRPELAFGAEAVSLAPGQTARVEATQPWSGYRPWSPHSPTLYFLGTRLVEGGAVADARTERFGFREVWVEGHRLLLNGRPVHLAGEWRHNYSLDLFRPEYIRQWYGMLKDLHMNYIRTHTYPHPRIVLDLADEMGILVSVEAGWHFGHNHAMRDERMWANSERHIRDIIARDKNHPSVILYSVGNECRWNADQAAIIERFPRLRALYEELDPTRIAYHDGDSSLWDERRQPLISRHYGLECGGEHGWDRGRPLHVGEMGKWHFGQPIDNCVFLGDEVFASFRECHRSIALEAADIIQQGRGNEVTCLFPWNLSGLDNYRPWPAEHTFDWPDPAAPHVKPLRSAPYGSEFAWWEPEGKGYSPGVSFEHIRHAFRPVAAVVREKRNRFFDDQEIRHTVTVVNDSGGALSATLRVQLRVRGEVQWERAEDVQVPAGRVHRVRWSIQLEPVAADADAEVVTTVSDAARQYDRAVRTLRIVPASVKTRTWDLPLVAVLGDGSMEEVLAAHGVVVGRVESLAEADPAETPLLLIERGAAEAGATQNKDLEAFCRAGGRAVILEQTASLMPRMLVDAKPVEAAHIRGGRRDVLRGFTAEDFRYWGDEPYGLPDSDSWVVVTPYRKPTCGNSRVLIDSGWGDFGHGGLNWAPLVETRIGGGLALACQLRLTDKAMAHPAACRLLGALLRHAAEWRAPTAAPLEWLGEEPPAYFTERKIPVAPEGQGDVLMARAGALDAEAMRAVAGRVRGGATAVLLGVDAASAKTIAGAFGLSLETADLGTIYNLVRPGGNEGLLDGISNQETYWLNKADYGPSDVPNLPITDTLLQCGTGEELLISERESCWREFYTQNAKAELTRMPVVTHYLWNGPRPSAAGLVDVPVGEGRLVLCQVPLPEGDFWKNRTFWAGLLNNLGVDAEDSLCDGPAVAPGTKNSEGHAADAPYYVNPSEELLAEMLKAAAPREHRMPNHALRNGFDWSKRETPGGTLTVPQDAERVAVFLEVKPGRPRKQAPVEGGLPNPDQQTLLELYGEGTVELYVNAKAHPPVELGAEGKATVADIDLDAEWNSVLLVWKPAGRSLRYLWRNRQGRPEVEFLFVPNC